MGASTDTDKGAVGKCHLEAEDIGSGDSVFQATRAAGIGGDVPPEGAVLVALRIGRVEEPFFDNLRLKHARDDGRFHDGDEVLAADLPDAVHPVHAHQDATPDGDATADVADTGAARGDRDVVPVRVGEYGRDFFGRTGSNRDLGKGGGEPLVFPQFGEARGIGDDTRGEGDQLAEIPLERRMGFET